MIALLAITAMLVTAANILSNHHVRAAQPATASAASGPTMLPPADKGAPRHRRPMAAVMLDASRIAVANGRSGTISLVRLHPPQVDHEFQLSGEISDIESLPDNRLLVCGLSSHQLVLLRATSSGLQQLSSCQVSRYPVSVCWSEATQQCIVAGLWSHRLDFVSLDATDSSPKVDLHVQAHMQLPFAPRCQVLLPGGRQLLVADAFGGQLALVDLVRRRLERVHRLPAHNIGGMFVDADANEVWVPHQILDEALPLTEENIEQGRAIANVLRRVPINSLSGDSGRLLAQSQVMPLGTFSQGAADPAAIAGASANRLLVALAGTGEVLITDRRGSMQRRIRAGVRPIALLTPGDSAICVAVDMLDDSLHFLDLGREVVQQTLALGERPPDDPVERGERLFYDARLARHSWLSCHSCHPDGHSSGLLADTLGDGDYGSPKRTLSLLGTADSGPWAWNGSQKELHDQVRKSVATTMHGPPLEPKAVMDLVAFLHSLPYAPPLTPAESPSEMQRASRGQRLFEQQGCIRCHVPPLTYTTEGAFDVGLGSSGEKFNPPSLRGVSQQAGYFHDKRADSLEDVFQLHSHQLRGELDANELRDLVRFLRGL